jgi:photosynthetic reaction center cytochrome c subunit
MIPGMKTGLGLVAAVGATLLGIAMISKFETPGQVTVQRGFRGVAMETNYNPKVLASYLAENKVPASLPQAPGGGAKASAVYKNVQVLGDLSVGQFTRLMVSLTNWVSPKQGCAYCHNTANMAEDNVYTKIVARRMIQMTQYINADWQPHVQQTGVTCYTCHRGNPVPNNVWYTDPGPKDPGAMMVSAGGNVGKNIASGSVGDSSLPYDPFTPFLENDHSIRVQGEQALPGANRHSIKETEWTWALMMHFSQSLGVNCTYCHNSRAFSDWEQSTPQRTVAWHGIRMTRDLNNDYLKSLDNVWPANRLGPAGDPPKVGCATCHQGVYKPLYGVSMLKDFPELSKPGSAGLAALNTSWTPPH